MILNRFPPDPAKLKIMILSSPKTGNTWLRWLLHYAYRLPIIELPMEWSDEIPNHLPDRFVTHQHLAPTAGLVQWMMENHVVVFTTIRHPGDTFLSMFHFIKWNRDNLDPASVALLKDGELPGKGALRYVQFPFPQVYALSMSWARLGAHAVRYEDLLADPVKQLAEISAMVSPLDDATIAIAALLCKPEQLTRPGLVDPRHLRTHTARRWVHELPASVVDAMTRIEPYAEACRRFSYDWDCAAPVPQVFDYDSIDPFRGSLSFDNGEPIGASLTTIYLTQVPGAAERWPDPRITAGDSFWNWLRAPCVMAWMGTRYPPATLTNLMWAIHSIRPDLQAAYVDPIDRDRAGFVEWFVNQSHGENELPWALVGEIAGAYFDSLFVHTVVARPVAEIVRIEIVDDLGGDVHELPAGGILDAVLEVRVAQYVARPAIGFTFANHHQGVLFGTDTASLGIDLPALTAGLHKVRLSCQVNLPRTQCFLSAVVGHHDDQYGIIALHRLSSARWIHVQHAGISQGPAWCASTLVCESCG